MIAHSLDGLKYYTFELFDRAGIVNGVFTRQGGVSPDPWATLNVGGMVGDAPGHIIENRRRLFNAVGRDAATSYDSWLVHGTEAIRVTSPRGDAPHQKADILLTDWPEITLFMRFADCAPIYLIDPIKRVVGLAHAGWKGTLQKVAAAAVSRMVEWYGSTPGQMLAAIGPSICIDHYPVGPEVTAQAKNAFGDEFRSLVKSTGEQDYLDLWLANRLVLIEAGVHLIETAEICTACNTEEWFSHRAEHGRTGRFGAVLALGEKQMGQ